ncbi:protein AF-10-like [Crotalus adamanteus]|uniref:Protein AF-10-like n=1 Tax=Crotalus adamanteus TaxID=8729 RepID=A0AAW1B263_CROAD
MVSSEPLLLPVSLEGEFSNSMKEMIGGCCVCSDERGWAENPLVYCDGHGCNVAVHQACYGIVQVPTGPWFCRKCESQERAARVKCELCPHKDGALKRTDGGGVWFPEGSPQGSEMGPQAPRIAHSIPEATFTPIAAGLREAESETNPSEDRLQALIEQMFHRMMAARTNHGPRTESVMAMPPQVPTSGSRVSGLLLLVTVLPE